ncbi:hypothetical protein Lesp02_35510 [Lentzea sp. NBRC 105346]|nr:tryptophan 7-halogenase [Lentzea sp. NBRC 105346]GLZ31363.1 hypothetical protein Lesp02_35510 [Lentzea sp. NBRC 105346]
MPDCDVAIVGGGPAGAAAAIALRRHGLSVVLFEASSYSAPRFGEALAPAVRPVLARLGVSLPPLTLPSYAVESAWGSPTLSARPFVFDPHGDGLSVDRAAFDRALSDAASSVGATVVTDSRISVCALRDSSWELGDVSAAAIICATGRGATLARSLGAQRRAVDQLVAVSVTYPADAGGPTVVEAVPDGWWYSAPVPSGRVVVLMTDADICRTRGYHSPDVFASAVASLRHIRVSGSGTPRVTSAASQRLERTGAGRWLAAGDEAMSVDPLTGRGVLHALLSGEAAGTAMAHWLLGDSGPSEAYEQWLDVRFAEYCRSRTAHYALETRWRDSPFWSRRS